MELETLLIVAKMLCAGIERSDGFDQTSCAGSDDD